MITVQVIFAIVSALQILRAAERFSNAAVRRSL